MSGEQWDCKSEGSEKRTESELLQIPLFIIVFLKDVSMKEVNEGAAKRISELISEYFLCYSFFFFSEMLSNCLENRISFPYWKQTIHQKS